jgi:SAM-dependent methyltransferase
LRYWTVPEDLVSALTALRPLLTDPDSLVRAVGSGRRRNHTPSVIRAELRPVDLKAGRHVQVVTTDGLRPTTRNLAPTEAAAEVDRLLAEPFGNWYVETLERVVQLRVTKKGQAQVHETRTSRRDVAPATHDRVKQHVLDPADPLFGTLGADADKRRQVDAFLRALAPVTARAAEAAERDGRRVRAVDLGCGNAYLTFAAQRWLAGQFPDGVHTTGIDVRPDMVERNQKLAADLDLGVVGGSGSGLDFETGTIEGADLRGEPVDLVLALHACDTATDDALAQAVRWRAPVILAAPCCHHDLQRQLTGGRQLTGARDATSGSAVATGDAATVPHPYGALTRHAILRERFGDVLTDALRADILRLLGYRVDVVEFVDSRHTPRNVLLRAVRSGAPPTPRRIAEYRDLVDAWQVRPALAERLAPELDAVLASVITT